MFIMLYSLVAKSRGTYRFRYKSALIENANISEIRKTQFLWTHYYNTISDYIYADM